MLANSIGKTLFILELIKFRKFFSTSLEIKPILLRLPLFDTELPFYVNYAKLGYIIGHEIFHCVDKTGIKYDKSGALREWTTDKFEKKYDDKTQCFIEQYRNYTEHYYGLSQDNSTVGEDVADNGGLRVAYMAYQHEMKRIQNLGKQPQLFPKLVDKKMTVEQIFFLATAQVKIIKYFFQNNNRINLGKNSFIVGLLLELN